MSYWRLAGVSGMTRQGTAGMYSMGRQSVLHARPCRAGGILLLAPLEPPLLRRVAVVPPPRACQILLATS